MQESEDERKNKSEIGISQNNSGTLQTKRSEKEDTRQKEGGINIFGITSTYANFLGGYPTTLGSFSLPLSSSTIGMPLANCGSVIIRPPIPTCG